MKKGWMVVFAAAGLVLWLFGVSFAQTQVSQEWVARYEGSAYDWANDIVVDATGNSYVTGRSFNSLTNSNDILTIKYDTRGAEKWRAWYSGSATNSTDEGKAIALDPSGDVIVTGFCDTQNEGQNVVTLKYNPLSGSPVWDPPPQYHGGVGSDVGHAVTVDAQGYVYVAASSWRGWWTYTDFVTLKYSPGGSEVWATRYYSDWDSYDDPSDIAVDPAGNVYITGKSFIDLNRYYDYVTIKYDSQGQNPMMGIYDSGLGDDAPTALALDGSEYVYVTGASGYQQGQPPLGRRTDMTTVKYRASDMGQVWATTYGLPAYDDYGNDIAVNGENIYVTGAITPNIPNRTDIDCATLKYGPNGGDPLWVKTFDNVERGDVGKALALDGYGDVYVTGTTQTDPNPLFTDPDYLTLKYSASGQQVWVIQYDGTMLRNSDDASSIALDPAGNVYVTGLSSGDGTNTDYATVKYNQREQGGGGFAGFLTEPSQGRHLVRDQWTGELHLVMHRVSDDAILYTKSTDGGYSWVGLSVIGTGKYPTVCIVPSLMMWTMVCVAYRPIGDDYHLAYRWFDPGLGVWQEGQIPVPPETYDPGPPSMVTDGYNVYVAYRIRDMETPNTYHYCSVFPFFSPASASAELVDASGNPDQPCVAYDAEGNVHAAWRRTTGVNADEIYYSKRSGGVWWSPEKVYNSPNYLSTQPFVECYGDSVFVAWTEGENPPSDVMRAARENVYPPPFWEWRNVSQSNTLHSESPTQAWREFTTWSEGTSDEPPMMFDINYWRPGGATGVVESNPTEWSYWTHSQMRYPDPGFSTDLWSAWTESPNPGQPPYRVLTKHTSFPFFGPGEGLSDYGNYYKVLAGQDTASRYCRKRDGVMRFGDKAVDFARDSLVYELPYLDPTYDYYLRVASYRETGNDWTQALSVDGGTPRAVRFAPNVVDTAWVQVPPAFYVRDRKVRFVLKNVRGDYVTGLGLTLFQRDPKSRGKGGGGQAGEPVTLPQKEVFAVYPNPVHSQAQVEYSLKASGKVRLSVYDITGRHVRTLEDGVKQAGVHKAIWDGKDASGRQTASGIYFVRLSSPESTKTARLVVVR